MIDAADIGSRVLAGARRGIEAQLVERRRRAAELAALVRRAAALDRAAGKPLRGQAGRIARHLRTFSVKVTERHVRRILLDTERFMSDSLVSHGSQPVHTRPTDAEP